ncbi:MAG: hypothetical protein L0220_09995 [Acidobacteria bacterium]|nr:hypothetical protein [Acidobacteriota bacterium]
MFQAQTQSFTTFTVSGKTGTICQRSGPYKCTTSPQVTIFVKRGQKFPLGPKTGSTKGQFTTWVMVKQ